jgi:hypothetical protein
MKSAIYLVLSILLVGLPGQAAETALIDFELEDQFKRSYRDDEWRGNVLLLIGSDENGSQFDAAWEQAIRDSVTGRADMGSLRIVHVADVRGVPFFLKGVVSRKFPEDKANPIILDWKGEFATAYGFEGDKANILVFDRNALLEQQLAVAGIESQKLDELVDVLVMLLGRPSNNEGAE